jgi:putative hydrolase
VRRPRRRWRSVKEDAPPGRRSGGLVADEESPWESLLRELFGERADDALAEMREMGLDPERLMSGADVPEVPGMAEHLLAQIRALMEQSRGQDVNWALAHDVARGLAAQGGDPSISAATAAAHREAVSAAELWLDAVTDLAPSTVPAHVWSRAEWVEATLPVFRHLAGPVAVSVSHALSDLIGDEARSESPILENIAATVCGMHVGQAAGTLAQEAFGGTDLGLLLVPEPSVVLVPRSVEAFAAGHPSIPASEMRAFLALRECAHVRLFIHAPWLAGHLAAEVERYARGVAIDPEALDRAVRDAGSASPAQLQRSISRGIFASAHSDDQRATLTGIETILALVEGWVEHLTFLAAAPHLPNINALGESMRRRRAAGGPAEHTFASLLGLDLRPRRAREAGALWAALEAEAGSTGRDAPWGHPDLLPRADDLADPRDWIAARVSGTVEDDVDRELREILGAADSDDDSGERA